MDSMSLNYCILVPTVLLALLYPLKCYITSQRSSRRNNLRLPPGPWQLPIIGSLHHLLGTLPHHTLHHLSSRYGPLMFLKLGEVPAMVVSSREAAKEVMKTHDLVFATRPQTETLKILLKQGQAIALAPYGDHWRQLRKICVMELLSSRRVQSFRPVREESVARLVETIASTTSALLNLSELITDYTAESTVHAIMGSRLQNRDAFIHYIDKAIGLTSGFSLADLFPSSRLARALCRKRHKAEAYRDDLFKFLDVIVCQHIERQSREEETFEQDLIDVLLRIQRQGSTSHPLTMGTIKAVIFDLLVAGTESAATTLQWAMAELMKNPGIMSRAQAEVRGAFRGHAKVADERVGELDYLNLIIKETLRLHTPTPLLIPRQCQETCNVLGYDVPKGSMVLVNAWAISRDPRYWDEPEEFKPERFENDTRDFNGNDFDFIPFGAGRRICPGMAFGIAQIKLALANILFYFDWSLPDGVRPCEVDMTETMRIASRKKRDLWLKAKLHFKLQR